MLGHDKIMGVKKKKTEVKRGCGITNKRFLSL